MTNLTSRHQKAMETAFLRVYGARWANKPEELALGWLSFQERAEGMFAAGLAAAEQPQEAAHAIAETPDLGGRGEREVGRLLMRAEKAEAVAEALREGLQDADRVLEDCEAELHKERTATHPQLSLNVIEKRLAVLGELRSLKEKYDK